MNTATVSIKRGRELIRDSLSELIDSIDGIIHENVEVASGRT